MKNQDNIQLKWQKLYGDLMNHLSQGDYQAMVGVARQMLSLRHNDAEVMGTLVGAYIELNQLAAAQKLVAKLILAQPVYIFAYILAAKICWKQNDFAKTIELLQTVVAKYAQQMSKREKNLAFNLLAATYREVGNAQQSVEYNLQAFALAETETDRAVDYMNYLFNLNYLPQISLPELFKAHLGYNDIFAAVQRYHHCPMAIPPQQKIRLGYISPDLRRHVVVFFTYKLLANYDKNKFTVICYAKGSEDAVSEQLKQLVDGWRSIQHLSAAAAAQVIYTDQIDILVDLSGHTNNSSLPILARKPAPVQLSGIGYFNTTGLAAVDYFLTDCYCDPIGKNDAYFSEKLLRLPHSHFCYTPPDNMPECQMAPCVKNGGVTFGSFNNFTKVNDEVLSVWKQILDRVADAKLILKSKVFGIAYGKHLIIERLKNLDFDLEKIELRPETPIYLSEYYDIDIALDPFPYPGGGTTCDALYMGVPVITLAGERHGARFGYSLLKNIGLDECIAANRAEYVDIAVALAADKAKLNEWHLNLREQMQKSPLMDGVLYMQDVEQAYRQIWQKFLQGARRELSAAEQALLYPVLASKAKQMQLAYDQDNYRQALAQGEKLQQESADCLPADAAAHLFYLLGDIYGKLGNIEQSRQNFLAASRIAPDHARQAAHYSSYLFHSNALPDISAAQMRQEHFAYQALFSEVKQYQHKPVLASPKLRIGYISPDFRRHIVTCFCYQLLAYYNKAEFTVAVFFAGKADQITAELRNLPDEWYDIAALTSEAAAQLIYEQKIDILFDLSGHTGNNCLPILACKPAPVQLSGIGYFNTTGLSAVDYFLTDIYCDPVGEHAADFTERLFRLPYSHLCYTPPATMPDCLPAAFLRNGYITFGSFNNYSKINDQMLSLWRDILAQVPNSKLILKNALFYLAKEREQATERLLALGFSVKQLDLRPASIEHYLEEYGAVDIALDTYPYPGGGTTCEALYMGVPVITLTGQRHGARFGYSILKNIGLNDGIAATPAEYKAKAIALAQNHTKLAALHSNLRQQMQNSPVMNGKLYVQSLEAAYRKMWRDYGEQKLPARQSALAALQKGDYRAVLEHAESVLLNNPHDGDMLYFLAMAAWNLPAAKEARVLAKQAIDNNTQYNVEAYRLLGILCYEQLDYVQSVNYFEAALEQISREIGLQKNQFLAEITQFLGKLYLCLGQPAKAQSAYQLEQQVAVTLSEKAQAYSNYLLSVHYDLAMSEADMLEAHKQYNTVVAAIEPLPQKQATGKGKIKIGYISPDFRRHVMFNFYYALLQRYDKTQFFVTCYALGAGDDYTQQLQPMVDAWRDLRNLSPQAAAAIIYADQIDILVDLAGHSANNALAILAYRPASVQLSGLGYVDTTGLSTIDYFLTDNYVDPIGQNDQAFTERLIRLPHSQFCYTGRSDLPASSGAPCLTKQFVTFASFNQYAKITDNILQMWHTILKQLPNSVLLIKSQNFASASAQTMARQRLAKIGFTERQVQLEPATHDYMERYLTVDIALDTYPYPGGGTTCDALYMGVPVITLVGQRHGARFGYSILKNIDLADGISNSATEYIAKAVQLAKDTVRLNDLHIGLRQMMQQSPLMDDKAYLQAIETAYQNIWQQFVSWQNRPIQQQIETLKIAAAEFVSQAQYSNARQIADDMLALDANNCEALYVKSLCLMHLADNERAMQVAQDILRLDNKYIGAYMIMAHIYKRQQQIDQEIKVLHGVINYFEQFAAKGLSKQELDYWSEAWSLLGSANTLLGNIQIATACFLKSSQIESNPAKQIAEYSNYLFALNYEIAITQQVLFSASRHYNKFFITAALYQHKPKKSTGKIRIGYISPDFRNHAVAFFSYALLATADRQAFTIICYALNAPDATTQQLKLLSDQWRNLCEFNTAAAAKVIYEDKIDILVDLSGHTAHNALPILAKKPAPVQVSGIGYFNTTGLDAVDYFLTDHYCDPPGQNDAYFCEQLLRLPHSHLCYTARSAMPECGIAPCLNNQYITFGSFNNFSKVTTKTLELWSEILQCVPHSRLILKSRIFASEYGRNSAIEKIQAVGIAADRVELRPLSHDYLLQYREIDIALDTYPYTGGATTCEALYMGVPVISLAGERHGSRFGWSLLHNAGIGELAANTPREYIDKAVALAMDVGLLTVLHGNLRSIVSRSKLMNAGEYTKAVEKLYKEIWRNWQESGI